MLTWQDPLDAPAGWVDVQSVLFDASLGFDDDGQVVVDEVTRRSGG